MNPPCAKCGSTETIEVVFGTFRCENAHYFQLNPKPVLENENAIRPAAYHEKEIPAPAPQSSRGKIARQATMFEVIAGIFALVGILFLVIFGFSFSSGDGGAWPAFYIFLGCLSSALWFYLIAQIIHIRANTEK